MVRTASMGCRPKALARDFTSPTDRRQLDAEDSAIQISSTHSKLSLNTMLATHMALVFSFADSDPGLAIDISFALTPSPALPNPTYATMSRMPTADLATV